MITSKFEMPAKWLNNDPPILQVEDFISSSDSKRLISYAKQYAQSVQQMLGTDPEMRNNKRTDLFFSLVDQVRHHISYYYAVASHTNSVK